MADVDWDSLRAAAVDAAGRAYAPYSKLQVGVAGLVDDGRLITGCNVENASYGLGLCAECGLVSALHTSGGGRLVAVSCVAGDGTLLMPCGRCRQLLYEHGGRELLVEQDAGPRRLAELLPDAFGPDDLPGGQVTGIAQARAELDDVARPETGGSPDPAAALGAGGGP